MYSIWCLERTTHVTSHRLLWHETKNDIPAIAIVFIDTIFPCNCNDIHRRAIWKLTHASENVLL